MWYHESVVGVHLQVAMSSCTNLSDTNTPKIAVMYSRMFRLRRLQRRKNFRTIPIFRQKRQNTTEPKSSTEGGSLNVFQVLLGFCAGAAGMYLLSPSDSRSFASQQVTIPVGHVGVIEKNGKIDPVPLESGSHWISYISKYYLFDTRTKVQIFYEKFT